MTYVRKIFSKTFEFITNTNNDCSTNILKFDDETMKESLNRLVIMCII